MDKIREISDATSSVALAVIGVVLAYNIVKISFFNKDKKQK